MKTLKNISIIFLILAALNTCKNHTKDTHIGNIKSIKGKTIDPPDTTISLINYSLGMKEIFDKKNLKIISFTDGGCPACIKQLKKLSKVKKELDSITRKETNLISFVLVKNKKYFIRDYYPELDSLPLILVNNYQFLEKNNIPVSPIYHTFLVDTKNKIQLVGNPHKNEKLKKLYIKQIKTITKKENDVVTKNELAKKIIEKTKEKYNKENKNIIRFTSPGGEHTGIFHLEHNKKKTMAIRKNNEMYFSLMNAKNNQEPVTLKITDKSGETIKEIESQLNKISYFSLRDKETKQYTFKGYYYKNIGEAVLFFYTIQ